MQIFKKWIKTENYIDENLEESDSNDESESDIENDEYSFN